MLDRIAAAVLAASLTGGAMAQPATTGQKPETSCTTSPAATSGHGEEKTSNSMAVERALSCRMQAVRGQKNHMFKVG